MAKGANVTKWDAGGTGDNIIPDGFIKSVEKVWIDTYTISSSATISSGVFIDVAKIPAGKKITSIEVINSNGWALAAWGTTSTISIGARYGTGSVTNATQFLAATTIGVASLYNVMPIKANTGIGVEVTTSTHTIFLYFATIASASTTAGTITTIVKYT